MTPTKSARPRTLSSPDRQVHDDRFSSNANARPASQNGAGFGPPYSPGLSAAHTGPEPQQDDALPRWAWPVAAMVLLVWHTTTLFSTILRSIRPAGHSLRTRPRRSSHDALDQLARIGRQSLGAPWTKGERTVQLFDDDDQDQQHQVYKVPFHLAIALTASTSTGFNEPETLMVESLQRYAYAAAQAGIRQLSWFDPEGVVVSAFPQPTMMTVPAPATIPVPHLQEYQPQPQGPPDATSSQVSNGHGPTASQVSPGRTTKNATRSVATLDIRPHTTTQSNSTSVSNSDSQFNANSNLQVTLLSASDGKASLARIATALLHSHSPSHSHSHSHPLEPSGSPESITAQAIDRAWFHHGGISPPQLLLLQSSAAFPSSLTQRRTTTTPHSSPVSCAQLPDLPPWILGVTELVSFWEDGGQQQPTEAEQVLVGLKQLAGAGQRYGR